MTPETQSAQDEFLPKDLIRLIACHGDHAAGACGHIVGRFARPVDPTWVVSFDGDALCVVEVRGDEIILAAA